MDDVDRILTTIQIQFDGLKQVLEGMKTQLEKLIGDHSELRDRVTIAETRLEELRNQHCDRGVRLGSIEERVTKIESVSQGKGDTIKVVQWIVVVLVSIIAGIVMRFVKP